MGGGFRLTGDRVRAGGARGGPVLAVSRVALGDVIRDGAERGRGKGAGLPELEHLVEAAENAGQDGHDQSVYGRWHPGTLLLGL